MCVSPPQHQLPWPLAAAQQLQWVTVAPGPPAVSPMPADHMDIDPSTSRLCQGLFAHWRVHVRLCWCRDTTAPATNSAWLRSAGFKDHPEMCHEVGLHSRAEPVGPAWHPVPSPDCYLELDLELRLHEDRDRQGRWAGRMGREDGQLAPRRDLGCSRICAGAGHKPGSWPLAWSGGTAAPGTPQFPEH